MNECYQWLTKIQSLKLDSKSVVIVGYGYMGKEYEKALSEMKIKDISIISLKNGSEKNKEVNLGSFKKILPKIKNVDLVILTLPTNLLIPATKVAIENGQKNILIEKPGSLRYQELKVLSKISKSVNIRVGYNRILYPNFHKLKKLVKADGGITSCNFCFTEWIHRLDLKKYDHEVLQHWGIQNSLHVISMAMGLIGMPKKITCYREGSLKWHHVGSKFVGSGISKKNIPFSYNADWGSGGRWGIDVMTKKNWYRLSPLEELHVCPKKSTTWSQIPFEKSYPHVKQGIAEEVALMLDSDNKNKNLISLEMASELIKLANKIFGYK